MREDPTGDLRRANGHTTHEKYEFSLGPARFVPSIVPTNYHWPIQGPTVDYWVEKRPCERSSDLRSLESHEKVRIFTGAEKIRTFPIQAQAYELLFDRYDPYVRPTALRRSTSY